MKVQGRGLAGCVYSLTVMNAPNPCSAHVQMREDGSVNIQTGACDIGQGSDTVLAMMAAEALSVPVEKVNVYSADTAATPYDFGTLSSRVTYTGGRAVLAACDQVRDILFEAAAKQLKTRSDRLFLSNGFIVDKYDSDKTTSCCRCGRHLPVCPPQTANGDGRVLPLQCSCRCNRSW